ncbi:MAG: VOC family protein [Chitinophagaceae bacterium]|nr:MAG: VOC family protein [Chitinophagaceae bacterium]
MTIKNALASVAVKDLKSSIRWYQNLLGRAPDSTPMLEVAEWKFEGGGWLQVYQGKQHVGSSSVTLAVTNIDEQFADLKNRNIEAEKPAVTEKVKIIMIKDPDGNSIAFAEALDATMAQ